MSMTRIAAASLALALSGGFALADGKKDCTTEPQAKWKAQADG